MTSGFFQILRRPKANPQGPVQVESYSVMARPLCPGQEVSSRTTMVISVKKDVRPFLGA